MTAAALPSSVRRRPGLVAGVAAAVVIVVATQVFPHRLPLGVVIEGVLFGGLNGLLALGLVLTYRVTRAINFAYGSMGGLGAAVGVCLYLGKGWPWPAAILVALVTGTLVGLGVGALVNWRFARSPRMVLTVATIGLSQLLGGIALLLPPRLGAPAIIPSVSTGLSRWHLRLKPVLFTGNDVLIVIFVPLVVVAVSWFLLRTDAGRAVRAIADNADRARLVGIPARRLMLGVWALSGTVAAASAVLAAPAQGIPISAAAGPSLLLPPLAAAVVARMDSLSRAFGASIVLGVLEQAVRLNIAKQAVETVVFLVIILVALLVQRRSESRTESADESSWSAVGGAKPLPRAVRSLPEIRIAGALVAAGCAVGAVLLPHLVQAGPLHHITVGVVFAITALSLVVLSGWGGVISLGQMAIVGIGSVVAGDLIVHLNLDFFAALVAAALAGALAAAILGFPTLRVRGIYLAVATLALAVTAEDYLFNPTNFASVLPTGVRAPVLWKRFPLAEPVDLYYLCVGALLVLVVFVLGVRHSRVGRVVVATRDNLRGAQAAAVSSLRSRVTAFMVSGAIAGVAGALNVLLLGSVGFESYPAADSIAVFAMVVIGGLSSIWGSIAGVALIVWLGVEFPKSQLLLTGVGVLVVLAFFPSGLVGVYERARDALALRVARRHGLDTSVWGDDAGDEVPEPAGEPSLTVVRGRADLPDDAADERPVLLRCRDVNAAYGSMQVLFGVDLTVREGDLVALLGTNGAGKSSLLRTLTGLLPCSRGSVVFDGKEIGRSGTEDIVAAGLTMMPGGRGIFGSLTVEENLRLASWSLRKNRSRARSARESALRLFPVLEQRAHQLAGDMSGGQQQMLSLAMAFIARPKLLCIDELSLGLAPTVVAGLLDAVRRLHAQGTTILIVEQSVNVALRLADDATFLEKGRVRYTGPTAQLLDRPDLLRAVFLGSAGEQAEPAEPAGPAPMLDRSRAAPDAPPASREVVLRCAQVTKRFGGITAVDAVDLEVHAGEVVGLIGHNGAGKTTLFDLISGFLALDRGVIHVHDEVVNRFPPHERSIAGLGRSFQDARLFPSMTVTETISLALERRIPRPGPLAAALRMPAMTDVEAAVAAEVAEIVDLLGLAAYRNRPTGDLSTGTRRIVELACVVAQRPAVVMLDEPTGGVAQAETRALGPLLRRVAEQTGCAMVLIDHDMSLMESMCDRLVALELGAVIANGTPAHVLSDPRVVASYLGTEDVGGRSGPVPEPVAVPVGADANA